MLGERSVRVEMSCGLFVGGRIIKTPRQVGWNTLQEISPCLLGYIHSCQITARNSAYLQISSTAYQRILTIFTKKSGLLLTDGEFEWLLAKTGEHWFLENFVQTCWETLSGLVYKEPVRTVCNLFQSDTTAWYIFYAKLLHFLYWVLSEIPVSRGRHLKRYSVIKITLRYGLLSGITLFCCIE